MNKTICFFNSNNSWGGGEHWHFDTALRLAKLGYRIIMYVNVNSQLYHRIKGHAEVEVRQINVRNTSFLNYFKHRHLVKKFKQDNIDSIILNLPSDLKLAGPAAKKAGIPTIIYRRGSALPVKNSFLNRYYFGKIITKVLVNSKATRNTLLQKNNKLIDEDRIHILYNGIDLDQIRFEQTPGEKSTIIIGNLGRMVYQKGQEMLLDVAEKLRNERRSFIMRIGGDGPYKEQLEKKIKDKGLDGVVELSGPINNPTGFLSDIQIFVLSSRWEGFGYVIAEAMACKKPVVAFNISSNPELIAHGETGYLVKPFDTAGMASHIIELIRDKALRKKMGEQGRKRIEKYFTVDRVINRLEELI